MEQGKKYCGVLFTKVAISNLLYALVPSALIEGKYYENNNESYFATDACEYAMVNTTDFLDDTSITSGIGLTSTDEEIQKTYEELTLPEAKEAYFNEICCYTYFATYSNDLEKVVVFNLDFENILDSVQSFENNKKTITASLDSNQETVKEDKPKKQLFAIDIENIKKLNQINSLDEIKKHLQDMINYYESCQNRENFEESTNSKLTGELIVKAFNSAYDSILATDDINIIKDIITKLNDLYFSIAKQMDNSIDTNKEVNTTDDYIFNIYDEFAKLLTLDDITIIKNAIIDIKAKQENNVKKIAQVYDNIFGIPAPSPQKKVPEPTPIIEPKKTVTASEMKEYFDKIIIGQEEAKEDVISTVIMNQTVTDPKNKNNCLLVGPTGSGKTLLIESVGNYLNVPVEIVDTTQITKEGYIGGKIEDKLGNLLAKANGNLELAEHGIICFDEIDKMGTVDRSDVNGTGVLNNLLTFINGTTYNVSYNNRLVTFNTANLTIFAAGAFTSVNEAKTKGSTSLGFGADIIKNSKHEDIKYEKLQVEDFVKYGSMPVEFMGRFTTISQLEGQTVDSLKEIIVSSNVSALNSLINKFAKLGVTLRYTEGYLSAVANQAIKLKTGARSLKVTIDKSVKKVLWEVLMHPQEYQEVILTDKTVMDNNDCYLKTRDEVILNYQELIKPKDNKCYALVKAR
jgi:ATP-dependent Clp protease ATP-binding subunit ClpX